MAPEKTVKKARERIPFFDCNAMVGRLTACRLHFSTVAELKKEMEYYEIDRALVSHSFSREYDAAEGNRTLLRELASEANLYPVLVLLPFGTGEFDEKTLRREVEQNRIRAARLFPEDHRFTLTDWNAGPLLALLCEKRILTFIDLLQARPEQLAFVLKKYPELPLAVSHTGYRYGRVLYPLLDRYRNLYIDTSRYSTYEGIEDICRRFGCERLIFGTHMPYLDAGSAMARILYAGISEEEKRAIARGNLERLLWGG